MANRFGLQIRAANGADAPGLAALMQAANRPASGAALAARLDGFSADRGAALIAVHWGPPSGVIVMSWCPTLEFDQPIALISLLLVDPDERRRGLGRMLLKAGAQAARVAGCGAMLISTEDGQDESLDAFCSASGFTKAGASYLRPLRKKS